MVKTIDWENGKVVMLDQSRLPIEVIYIECENYLKVAEGIKKLWIRGAPAIGIAAAMGVALAAQDIKAENYEGFIGILQNYFELSWRNSYRWTLDKSLVELMATLPKPS